MTEPSIKKDTLDLDTATTLLLDLQGNLLPWVEVANQLLLAIQIATTKNIYAGLPKTSALLDRVILYIEQYSELVDQRLEKNYYRTPGQRGP